MNPEIKPLPDLEVPHPTTGKPVKSVRVRLPAEQVKQILAAPPEMRVALATEVLKRRAEKHEATAKAAERASVAKAAAKVARKRQRAARRRNR